MMNILKGGIGMINKIQFQHSMIIIVRAVVCGEQILASISQSSRQKITL